MKRKLNIKNAQYALKNSAVMALLVIAMLSLFDGNIQGETPLITLGWGLVGLVTVFPVYYLSFRNRWNEGALLSVKRLYTPSLTLVFSVTGALIYAPLAYGYNPVDFFVTAAGSFNGEMIWLLFKYSLTAVVTVHLILFLGESNEREIIVNAAPSALKKKYGEAPAPERRIPLQGGPKSGVVNLDVSRFLYAESDANYLKVHQYCQKHEVLTLRMTIKQFEGATGGIPEIIRCHRAFMVNIRNVSYYESRSGKGEAHFSVIEETVPVSKTYAEVFLKMLKQE